MYVFKTLKDKSNKAIVWHDKRSCVFSPINRYMNLVRFFFKNGILHNGVYPFVRLKPFFILGVSRGRIKLKKRYHIHTPTKTRINTLSLVIGYYHVLSRRHFAGIFSFFFVFKMWVACTRQRKLGGIVCFLLDDAINIW